MSYFAKINSNNVVTDVIRAGQDFINSGVVGDPSMWIETSYTGAIRKNYAGIGFTYDRDLDAFIPPKNQDNNTYVLNKDTCQWDLVPTQQTDSSNTTTTTTEN